MTNSKLKLCKHCGKEIAKSAKKCPHCGGKNKFPVLLTIVGVLAVFMVIGMVGGSSGSNTHAGDNLSSSTEVVNIEYIPVDATDLFDVLNDNPLKAEKTYQDAYLEVTGYVDNIDSDGQYVSIGADPDNWDYFLDRIQCFVTDDAQLDLILEASMGQKIVIKGQITAIGEVLGYQMDIAEIVLD